uniref:Origin recognition complex subunit 1 n=1 Tax=Lygus hesperus TaxID=30085 RepID=A0A0A9ZA64_LYGHE
MVAGEEEALTKLVGQMQAAYYGLDTDTWINGREKEVATVEKVVTGETGELKSIYMLGAPGTGKTAVARYVMQKYVHMNVCGIFVNAMNAADLETLCHEMAKQLQKCVPPTSANAAKNKRQLTQQQKPQQKTLAPVLEYIRANFSPTHGASDADNKENCYGVGTRRSWVVKFLEALLEMLRHDAQVHIVIDEVDEILKDSTASGSEHTSRAEITAKFLLLLSILTYSARLTLVTIANSFDVQQKLVHTVSPEQFAELTEMCCRQCSTQASPQSLVPNTLIFCRYGADQLAQIVIHRLHLVIVSILRWLQLWIPRLHPALRTVQTALRGRCEHRGDVESILQVVQYIVDSFAVDTSHEQPLVDQPYAPIHILVDRCAIDICCKMIASRDGDARFCISIFNQLLVRGGLFDTSSSGACVRVVRATLRYIHTLFSTTIDHASVQKFTQITQKLLRNCTQNPLVDVPTTLQVLSGPVVSPVRN